MDFFASDLPVYLDNQISSSNNWITSGINLKLSSVDLFSLLKNGPKASQKISYTQFVFTLNFLFNFLNSGCAMIGFAICSPGFNTLTVRIKDFIGSIYRSPAHPQQ